MISKTTMTQPNTPPTDKDTKRKAKNWSFTISNILADVYQEHLRSGLAASTTKGLIKSAIFALTSDSMVQYHVQFKTPKRRYPVLQFLSEIMTAEDKITVLVSAATHERYQELLDQYEEQCRTFGGNPIGPGYRSDMKYIKEDEMKTKGTKRKSASLFSNRKRVPNLQNYEATSVPAASRDVGSIGNGGINILCEAAALHSKYFLSSRPPMQ